jgi:dihydroxyacetone kinase
MKVEIRMSSKDTMEKFQKAVSDFESAGFDVQTAVMDSKIHVSIKPENEYMRSKIGLDKFFDVVEKLKIEKGKIFFIA